MCVLTGDEIRRELAAGTLRIEPLRDDQIGAASVDLHLGSELRVPEPPADGLIHLTDESDPAQFTRLVKINGHYVLGPGETIHGVTLERLYLPPNLCGWLEGRSRTARFGLTVHTSSGFVHPGVRNHQVLEMTNVSGVALALHAGIRICQIVLERTEGHAVYGGRFASQSAP
jgi:dCTP deaminase